MARIEAGCVLSPRAISPPSDGSRPTDRQARCQLAGSIGGVAAAPLGSLREGLGRAQKILYLGDGAEWVWNLKKDRWNTAVELLDFYHGSEHLWSLGRALRGETQPQLSQWVQPLRHQLRHGREQRVLGQIAQLKKRRGEAGKVIRREKNYFETHASRVNYQAIAKRGWPIGSGAVESACRQKQCRFKRCGQFWSKQGLRNLCALDEARRNHHWDQLWSPN